MWTPYGKQLVRALVVVVVVVTVIDLVDAKIYKKYIRIYKKAKPVNTRDKEVRALQDEIKNGASPGLIMPRLMDLLRQIDTTAASCPCRTKNGCRGLGGSCSNNTTPCNGRRVGLGCRGDGCTCCIQNDHCWTRWSCRKLKGTCVSNCTSCTGDTIYAGCRGNCVCCVPSQGPSGTRPDWATITPVPSSSFQPTPTVNPPPVSTGSSTSVTPNIQLPGPSSSDASTVPATTGSSTSFAPSGSLGPSTSDAITVPTTPRLTTTTKPDCANPGSSCGIGGHCSSSCEPGEEAINGLCEGESCTCCKKKDCANPGSSCGIGGHCSSSCEPGEEAINGLCAGESCTCCKKNVRCAPGFFVLGDECFKVFETEELQWGIAKRLCDIFDSHTFLAEPKDSAALAQYVFDNYESHHHYWIGGRGDGISVKWLSGGTISQTEPWQDNQPSSSSNSVCLDLRLDANPLSRPLAVHTCKTALQHCYICESSLRL